jgi:hemerythrin-like domain-containing protein
MSSQLTGANEMLAVHNALRREYASMPLLVKSVPDDDAVRAGVVADHISLMGTFMALHHAGEDDLLWPLLRERVPGSGVVAAAEADHTALAEQAAVVADLTEAWRDAPSASNRAALHAALVSFERALLQHLGHEETEALPLLEATVTEDEFAALRAYVREGLAPEQRSLVLGMFLDDSDATSAAIVLSALDDDELADFETRGAPAYRAYRERLLGP